MRSAPLVTTISAVFAFLLAMVSVAGVRRLALRLGIVDAPGGRKQHDDPVPPVGGIGVFLAFLLSVGVFGEIFAINLPWALLASLAIILIMGVIDDIRDVDARLKFAVHFLVAALLVIGGDARITHLGDLLGFGSIALGFLSIPFSIACVVYIINALNMMDGLDGLAGGNAVIIFFWFGLCAAMGGNAPALFQMAIFSACLLGFLVFNARAPWRKKACIFLGDAGSTGIAIVIAWFAITLSQGPAAVTQPASVAWIIALPIVDAFGLLVARILDRKPPFAPDRRHFHHHFIHAGFSVVRAVYVILLWSFLLGAFGVLGAIAGLPAPVLGWLWIALWIGHTLLTIRAERFIVLLDHLRVRIGSGESIFPGRARH